MDGCDRRHKSRGFCDPHYLRWLATGDPEPGRPIGSRKPPARTECSIDGCDRLVLARGWCAAHYQRWKAHGDPLLGRLAFLVYRHGVPTLTAKQRRIYECVL